jgi:hypothetical protein
VIRLLHASATVCLIVLAICAWQITETITKTAASVRELAAESQQRIKDTSQNANALLIQLGLTADNVRRASEKNEQYTEQAMRILRKTETTVETLNTALVHLDYNVNAMVQKAELSLADSEQVMRAAAQAIDDTNNNLQPVLDNAAKDMELLGYFIQDANRAIDDVNKTTEAFADVAPRIAANVEKMSADGTIVTGNIAEVSKPKGFLRRFLPGIAVSAIGWLVFK